MTTGSASAREALARHDWTSAYELLTAEGTLDADDSDLLAEACWWLGKIEDCIAAREAAFRGYIDGGEERRAAQCAVWLVEHQWFLGRPSIAGAWLRRARKLIGGQTEVGEYGNLLLREAEALHSSGQVRAAGALADEAAALARRLGDDELEALALQVQGRVLIDAGESVEGMGCLDEAMLFALDDRLSPYAAGKIYCSLITACDAVGDIARAAEWTDATLRWSGRHPFSVFPGLCRVHRAQILGWRGAWAEAVEEARRASAELQSVNVGNAAAAWAEIGDIRRRLGDLDGAEEAFRAAEELCGRPAAGLALLRLAQGRPDLAATIVDDALEGQRSGLERARLLPAKVQIELANGRCDPAAEAATELEGIAERYRTDHLGALAATSCGRVALARGDYAAACDVLRRAVELWERLEVPYEAATARLLLGQSCRGRGDAESAAVLLTAAAETFDRLGAVLEARGSRALHDVGAAALPAGLTVREAEVLRLVAEGMTNKEIAARLQVSPKTIGRHLENIFVKIGVSSRSAATAFAVGHRLAD